MPSAIVQIVPVISASKAIMMHSIDIQNFLGTFAKMHTQTVPHTNKPIAEVKGYKTGINTEIIAARRISTKNITEKIAIVIRSLFETLFLFFILKNHVQLFKTGIVLKLLSNAP